MAIRRTGIVGCGLMGGGIAQTFAQAGYETVVREVNQQLLDKGMARIHSAWDTLASKGTSYGSFRHVRQEERQGLLRLSVELFNICILAIVQQKNIP
jgi:3-hydroxybutyryl-CoA dehydrogenase